MTNTFSLVTALWLSWVPGPETNVVNYEVAVNHVVYQSTQPLFLATNLYWGSNYEFCVKAIDEFGLKSLAACVSTNLPRPNWVVITNRLEHSLDLSNWTLQGQWVSTNTLELKGFFRSRSSIWQP